MIVKLLRIDSRLLHGQVAVNWVKDVGAETIICAGDKVADDQLRKTLIMQAAPPGVKTNVLSIDKAGRVYANEKYADMPVMFVVESPADAVDLVKAGIKVNEVNLGGVTFKSGAVQVGESVYLLPADAAAIKELSDMGIKVWIQTLPVHPKVDAMQAIAQKGLLS